MNEIQIKILNVFIVVHTEFISFPRWRKHLLLSDGEIVFAFEFTRPLKAHFVDI